MEIGPIFRALMHNKTRFWLITVEVALTFAVVANCVSIALELRAEYMRPSGYDEENLLVVIAEPFDAAFEDENLLADVRDRDLAALAAHPGVRSASATQAIPMSGGGSGTGRKALGSELETSRAPYFRVAGNVIETLGVDLIAGRSFEPEDWDYEEQEDGTVLHRNAIVTQDLANDMFPDGDALGKVIQDGDGEVTNTIVGIVRYMHNSWPVGWDKANNTMLLPDLTVDERRALYMVRTEPGAIDSVIGELEAVVTGVDPRRIVRVETLTEIKDNNYSSTIGIIKILTTVIALLLFVTGLGIVGLTSFSVTQRTRQIGTRRALGASRGDIVRYFLVENWIITGIGLVAGLALALGLNYALVQIVDTQKLDWRLLASGMALLWGTGVLAALAPALRASSVAPVTATRSV